MIEALIARSPLRPPRILFNYCCAATERWASPEDQAVRSYQAVYANSGAGLVIAPARASKIHQLTRIRRPTCGSSPVWFSEIVTRPPRSRMTLLITLKSTIVLRCMS